MMAGGKKAAAKKWGKRAAVVATLGAGSYATDRFTRVDYRTQAKVAGGAGALALLYVGGKKAWGLGGRMAARLSALTDSADLGASLRVLGKASARHEETLSAQSRVISGQGDTLSRHEASLEEHGGAIGAHSDALGSHAGRIVAVETALGEHVALTSGAYAE